MISVYTSAFNLLENSFPFWKETLLNNYQFADEMVIAVNESTDNTWEILNQLKIDNNLIKLQLIKTNINYLDPALDGKIKNEALQATTLPYKVGVDADEALVLRQKPRWLSLFKQLEASPYKAAFVPSLDLYGDKYSIPWEQEWNIKQKWYLHLSGLYRGIWKEARKENGLIDNKKSDGCELIDNDGNLVKTVNLLPPMLYQNLTFENYISVLKKLDLYVYHRGYEDLESRAERNKKFWEKQWKIESGEPKKDCYTNFFQLLKTTYKHTLPLWDE